VSPHWVLDLDNTLYPAGSGLFARIDERIDAFMVGRLGIGNEEVAALRTAYRDSYGVTLGGLMAHHGVDPAEYLAFVHDVPLADYLRPDAGLADALDRLPGERVVFTNGSEGHARAVLGRLGVEGRISAVFDIGFMDYVPKPRPHGYRKLLGVLGADAGQCWMVDDLPANLDTARSLGMHTVLCGGQAAPPHRWVRSPAELPAAWEAWRSEPEQELPAA
jgi:putative hydrolase of the HAD superfamily